MAIEFIFSVSNNLIYRDMKTIKEQIKSLFNGVINIELFNNGYIVTTQNVFVTNSTLNKIKEELKCNDIRIGINNEQKLLTYELFFGKITDRIKTFADAWEYCGKQFIDIWKVIQEGF